MKSKKSGRKILGYWIKCGDVYESKRTPYGIVATSVTDRLRESTRERAEQMAVLARGRVVAIVRKETPAPRKAPCLDCARVRIEDLRGFVGDLQRVEAELETARGDLAEAVRQRDEARTQRDTAVAQEAYRLNAIAAVIRPEWKP